MVVDGNEPRVPIDGYPRTWTRNPRRPPEPFERPAAPVPNLADRLGVTPGLNLAQRHPGAPLAMGQLIQVGGRVLDPDGRPVPHAVIEIWHCNAAGRYDHPTDSDHAPLDPSFLGHGRITADAEGRYAFATIKPGGYPVPASGGWWRPPHIHFSVFGPSFWNRLVTQMYFPGDPLNEIDRLLGSVPDPAARAAMVAGFAASADGLFFTHDLRLP